MSNDQSSLFGDAPPPKSTETLDAINAEMIQRAQLIPELKDRVILPGEGDPATARLTLVGESPGPADIATRRIFNGPSGELLDRILHAIGLTRKDCYLTNTVKIVTNPGEELTPAMLSFFTPYLHRELAVVDPKILITSGNTPTKALLNSKQGITQMRGTFHDYHGAKLMPTFNPAYLLRDPTKKREVWEDMKKVRELLAALKQ